MAKKATVKKKQKKTDKAEGKVVRAGAIPKRIAGVKVPKQLRESGEKLAEVINHPIFADVVAASLVAAANALREQRGLSEAASAALGKAARTVEGKGNVIGSILTEAAIEGITRIATEPRGRAKGGAAKGSSRTH